MCGITTGHSLSFKYNDEGIRTEKTYNGTTTKYHLIGDKVTYETNGTDEIYYTYNSDAQLVSINLNGTEYYYVRNGQNDIIGLIDSSGTQVVTYTYDTWGRLISTTGTLASTLGVKNPYRYRGYRYDTETGLYYLNSRYYNPEWGRFISADEVVAETGKLLSGNMFAYCYNNPINMADPSGHIAWWIVGGIIGAIAGGIAGAVISYKSAGRIDWRYVAGGVVGGALAGAGLGWATQAVSSAIIGAGTFSTMIPQLGRKLDYIFGKATGTLHNIRRSKDMLRQLNSIGIFDNNSGRNYLSQVLNDTLNNPNNIVKIQENGRIVKECLLMGPNGALKLETVWEGVKLITMKLIGGN